MVPVIIVTIIIISGGGGVSSSSCSLFLNHVFRRQTLITLSFTNSISENRERDVINQSINQLGNQSIIFVKFRSTDL